MLNSLKITSSLRSLVGQQSFAQRTMMVFIASMLGNVFSYLYLLFAGRALGPESYGAFGSLFGIFYIFCLIGDALRISTANNVASLKGKVGDSAAIKSVQKPLLEFILAGVVIILALMANSRSIANYFQMSTSGPIYVLGASLLTTLFLFSILGLIQGLELFGWLASAGYLIPQSFKFLLGASFVWVGWGLGGVVGALLVSNLIAITAGVLPLAKLALPSAETNSYGDMNFRDFVVPVLLIGIVICVPTSVDVMLVTHFFSSDDAGIYNAVATMGKVVLFLPIAVSLVMLPQVSQRHSQGKDTASIVKLSLACAVILSGIVVLLYWCLSEFLMRMLFGSEYLEAASLIVWYGIAMALFAVNYLLAQYNLAVSNKNGVFTAVVVTVAEVAVIYIYHHSLLQVIMIMLFGNLLLMVLSLLPLVMHWRKSKVPTEQQ